MLSRLEAIAVGRQAPDFTLSLTDGTTVSKDDFKGKYLPIYHWGMCPGSMQIDPEVRALYGKYNGKGLSVIGLTESIDEFRNFAEGIPEGSSSPSKNQETADTFLITGWPYFILIGPDGSILARDFHNAFYQAKTILDDRLGE